MPIKVTVWGENVHEQTSKVVPDLYPDGMHGAIAASFNVDDRLVATTATLQESEHDMIDTKLVDTDVLIWWGHAAHGDVDDAVVERIVEHVWAGMGIILLHSAHFAKTFKRLMGTPCNLTWRECPDGSA